MFPTKCCFENPIKMIGHEARLRDVTAQSFFQFMSVLVLITCVIHRSKSYFDLGGYIVYSTNHLGKNLTGRRCRAYRTISYEICGQITPFKTTWT